VLRGEWQGKVNQLAADFQVVAHIIDDDRHPGPSFGRIALGGWRSRGGGGDICALCLGCNLIILGR
jgi:hypothetical protein